jgi:hypothetical protein
MKKLLLIIFTFCTNVVFAQTQLSDYYDAGNANRPEFSYNVTVKIQKNEGAASDAKRYTATLVQASPDSKGFYNANYDKKYYTASQLGNIYNPNDIYLINVKIIYECYGKQYVTGIIFRNLNEQLYVPVVLGTGGKICESIDFNAIEVKSAVLNQVVYGEILKKIEQTGSSKANQINNSNNSNNPLNNNTQSNNSNGSAQTRNQQQQNQQQQNQQPQNQQQQRGTGNLNNTRSNTGSSNNTGSGSNAKPTTPGPITNMSNYVGIEGSKESMQVYQQDGKYYVKKQNGTVTPTTKQYFDQVTAVGSKNAQIEANLKKTLNTPISNYNSETNTYSNPLPTYSNTPRKSYSNLDKAADFSSSVTSTLNQWSTQLHANDDAKVQSEVDRLTEEQRKLDRGETPTPKRVLGTPNGAYKIRQDKYFDEWYNRSRILRTWQGFNDYVVKQIPYLLEKPSPSWETLLGSPKYATVFGKDIDFIVKNFKPVGERKNLIKKDVSIGRYISRDFSDTDFLFDFYAAYPSSVYKIDYNLNNVFSKKYEYRCKFIFDENDIVIGIKIDIDTYSRHSVDEYIQDIKNKIGDNYIPVNGKTLLLKDKLIIFNYDDIVMYDMNYFYDRIQIKFPDEYLNIEKLSNGQFKLNFAGIYFRKGVESSAIQSKIKLQTGWEADELKKIKFESLVTSEEGIIVGQVMKGSVADKAGLKDGDIITEFRGEKVVMPYMFALMMLGYAPEGRISVSYLRAGQEFKTAFVYNIKNDEKKPTQSASSSGNPQKKTNKKPVVKPAVKKAPVKPKLL